jgi:hypothetical protein
MTDYCYQEHGSDFMPTAKLGPFGSTEQVATLVGRGYHVKIPQLAKGASV